MRRTIAFSALLLCATAARAQDDPELARGASIMWGLRAVRAPEAWRYGHGERAIVAAVVDSGVDRAHEDLEGNLWTAARDFQVTVGGVAVHCRAGDFGYDTIDGDCAPQGRDDHGTNVAGIIGARGGNGKGVAGVNWNVTLLPVAFRDAAGAAKALEFVRRVKQQKLADVRVVNLSWTSHQPSPAIEEQLMLLAAEDVVIVAAAGNEHTDLDSSPVYPAAYARVPTLITVAATRSDGHIARSSNRGAKVVSLAAPGITIRTTDPGNSYDSPFGTSMAAAFVTGAVALLASQCPALDAPQLRELVLRTADRRPHLAPYVAEGRFLNVLAAAEACAAAR